MPYAEEHCSEGCNVGNKLNIGANVALPQGAIFLDWEVGRSDPLHLFHYILYREYE
jgi:hypothetical protein